MRNSTGQTIDFLLTAKRDAQAAKRFFRKAMNAVHTQEPRVINVDKNAAYLRAVEELKEKKELSEQVELRQNKYLNKCDSFKGEYIALGENVKDRTLKIS